VPPFSPQGQCGALRLSDLERTVQDVGSGGPWSKYDVYLGNFQTTTNGATGTVRAHSWFTTDICDAPAWYTAIQPDTALTVLGLGAKQTLQRRHCAGASICCCFLWVWQLDICTDQQGEELQASNCSVVANAKITLPYAQLSSGLISLLSGSQECCACNILCICCIGVMLSLQVEFINAANSSQQYCVDQIELAG
jgi:hypothetical protein